MRKAFLTVFPDEVEAGSGKKTQKNKKPILIWDAARLYRISGYNSLDELQIRIQTLKW